MSVKQKTAANSVNIIDLNERELIKKSRNGDLAAFEQLISAYDKRVYNVGLRMLGNSEDAADMTQEVMIKIYRNLGSFRGDSSFSTWVYRIAVNTCRDMLRSAYHNKEQLLSNFGEDDKIQPELEIADYSSMPENIYIEGELKDYLLELISGLSPKYRIVVVMREISYFSYQEIADVLHISVGTVKSRLNRARAAMRKKVLADEEQHPNLMRLFSQGGH